MIYDMTKRQQEAWKYYDDLLTENINKIAELSGVDKSLMVKLNPAEFIEKSQYQVIRGYEYIKIKNWIDATKKDGIYLISPLDAIKETAEQIGYKQEQTVERKIRASKCEIVPVTKDLALDFCERNHRQSLPHISDKAVYLGLLFKNELVAIMGYDMTSGAVRGTKEGYELVRLAIARRVQIHGGASKLQKACEEVLTKMGVERIFSYSNATINNGGVYEKLGFKYTSLDDGQPFVIMRDNRLIRLANLHPYSTDEELALRMQLKTHIGGNKMWVKYITKESEQNG